MAQRFKSIFVRRMVTLNDKELGAEGGEDLDLIEEGVPEEPPLDLGIQT